MVSVKELLSKAAYTVGGNEEKLRGVLRVQLPVPQSAESFVGRCSCQLEHGVLVLEDSSQAVIPVSLISPSPDMLDATVEVCPIVCGSKCH